MKLSQLKQKLTGLTGVNFELPNGKMVPSHFHVTEIGMVQKHFIDCGGTVRYEKVISLQLWEAGDHDHRLAPQKLKGIITLSEKTLAIEDADIEVEYQGETIGKYGLDFNGRHFVLQTKQTACLASDSCGTPGKAVDQDLSMLQTADKTCCTPGAGCC